MTTSTEAPATRTDRILAWMEAAGNRLPQPFNLFVWLFVIVGAIGTAAQLAGVTVQVPGSDEVTEVKGLFTGEGLAWFTETMGENYVGFPPLVTVLPILLAIGIAEKTGYLSAAIRKAIGAAPRWVLPYMVGFVGVTGSIMADSAFVIIPPLAALAFKAVGRHPVAGLLGGFAAAGAGYSTSIFPTSLDALFAGITNAVLPSVPTVEQYAAPVNPISNYWFNIASSVALSIVAGLIIDKIIEPRLHRTGVSAEEVEDDEATTSRTVADDDGGEVEVDTSTPTQAELTPEEQKGFVAGTIALLVASAVIAVAVLLPMSPWRNEEGAFLPRSPLLSSIVFVIFVLFAISGFVFGKVAGTIDGFNDVPRLMGSALRDMIPFLVLAFAMGQFIALFNWSGIGSWIAVGGAEALQNMGATGFTVIVLFVMLCSIINLFIISGSSMWTLMAAVFVPMFGLIGFEPAFVQAAFRVGDSATQIITPMNPYMIVMLGYLQRYIPKAGFGTLMSNMVAFVPPFWLTWLGLLAIWYFFGLPLGPGNDILIDELR